MAKIFLPPDGVFTLAASNSTVFGASGRETVAIAAGASGLVIDQNVDWIRLPGSISDYLYWQTGNQLRIYDNSGATLIATVTVRDGSYWDFSGGSLSARFAEDGTLCLSDWMVSPTAPSPLLPSVYDYPVYSFEIEPIYFGLSPSGQSLVIEGGYATFTVGLSWPQSTPASVDYTLTGYGGAVVGTDTGEPVISGEGISVSGSTITFAPGSTMATVSVPIISDSLVEIGEGINMRLVNPSPGISLPGAGSQASGAFLQDKVLYMPAFSLASNAADNAVQEAGSVVFTITPSSMLPQGTYLKLVLAGVSGAEASASAADFYPSTITVPFDLGDTAAKTVTVSVIADGVTEGDEVFQASLFDYNSTLLASLTGVIKDVAEGVYVWQDTTQVSEGGSLVYTVTSIAPAPSGGITIPYTLSGSATAALDYSGSAADGTLLIPAGATSARLTLRTLTDDTTEGTETVAIALGTPIGAPLVAGRDTLTTTLNDISLAPQTLVCLQPGESFVLDRSGIAVAGAAGVETAVLAVATAGVAIDQNVEQVQFPFASSACRFQQAGGQLVVFDSSASVRLATLTPQNDSDGTRLLFNDAGAEARWDNGALTVAGVVVGAIPAAIDFPSAAIAVGISGVLPAGTAAEAF